jgi:NADPH2:quinone reductase
MSVSGVNWGVWAMRDPRANAANFEQLFAWFEQGKIKPHIGAHRPFDQLVDACRDLYAGKAIGKTIIQIKA